MSSQKVLGEDAELDAMARRTIVRLRRMSIDAKDLRSDTCEDCCISEVFESASIFLEELMKKRHEHAAMMSIVILAIGQVDASSKIPHEILRKKFEALHSAFDQIEPDGGLHGMYDDETAINN